MSKSSHPQAYKYLIALLKDRKYSRQYIIEWIQTQTLLENLK